MGDMKFLDPCLTSIYSFAADLKLELIVVAYKCDRSRLVELKHKFSPVQFVEIGKLNGYSENMNVALRQAQGKYSMVLNDDTYFSDNCLQTLVETFKEKPDAAFVSPVILNFDGTVQMYGRPGLGIWEWFCAASKLNRLFNRSVPSHDSRGEITITHCVSGACFVARSDVLKRLNYFDEYYFGTPDDAALSTLAQRAGYKIYLNPRAHVYHYGSASAKAVHAALIPAYKQGEYYYFRTYYGAPAAFVVRSLSLAIFILKAAYWKLKKADDRSHAMLHASLNGARFAFKDLRPKDVFERLSRGL